MLSAAAVEVLTLMRDFDEELVYERGTGYVGMKRVRRSIFIELLRAMALRADSFNKSTFERYTINETGRELLKMAEGPEG